MTDSAYRLDGVSEERPWPALETHTTEHRPDAATAAETLSAANDTEENGLVDFTERDGVAFAGIHLLVELWDAANLSDVGETERTLKAAARAAGATVLHSYLHPFGPEMGVSGVVVLAESHISIHTWPERGYAAVDIFMCGDCDPRDSLPVLEAAFRPGRMEVAEHRRGLIGGDGG